MTKEFKITLGDDDLDDDLLPYTNAESRDSFLFELFHNFFRQWKHSDKDPDLDEVKEKLFELKDQYKVIMGDY